MPQLTSVALRVKEVQPMLVEQFKSKGVDSIDDISVEIKAL